MKISRNKKILVTAITVFSISAIGISINALTGAFSLDSMSRDAKYKTDAYISRAGDEIENEDEYEGEDEDENEASPEIPEEEKSPGIDAVSSATPDTEVPGGKYTAGEEVMTSQGKTAVDIKSSATPKAMLTIPGKPASQNASLYPTAQMPDVVSSATPKTGSAAPGVNPAPNDAPVPGIVPAPGVDIVSSATPKKPSPGSSTGTSAGINSDAAKQLFLDKVPGAAITEFELDEDDGILIYEIEAYIGQNKYAFKLDANTGAILSYEEDITDTEDAAEPDDDYDEADEDDEDDDDDDENIDYNNDYDDEDDESGD